MLTALTVIASCAQKQDLNLHIGSYNIRYQNSGDNERGNSWESRCPVICDILNYEDFDVFGVQEALDPQMEDLKAGLDGYACVGVGREDGAKKGEYAAIFYKTDRVKLIDWGTFWLSETPETVGSVGWDAALERICTWAHLEKDGRAFWFMNMHMDHVGVVARRESAKLVVSRIKEMCGDEKVILTGDYNVDQTDEIYRIFTESGLLKDCYECAHHKLATNGTFNSYHTEYWTESRIDHLLVSPKFDVDRYAILTYMRWQQLDNSEICKSQSCPNELNFEVQSLRTPSDHYPVGAYIRLAE